MATKPEETNTAPAEGAGLEKQPEPNLMAESAEKKEDRDPVESASAGVASLSVQDKRDEEKKAEEAPSAKVNAAEANTVTPTTGPVWPETAPDHPLTKFYDEFEALVSEASHKEVYGIELTKSDPFHTKLILQKFLRANQGDLEKAKKQLLDTLVWRREFDPIKAAGETFDKSKFAGLGYVLELEGVPESPNKKDIATFNIYGAVKDNKATFGDLEGFLRWRVGLMEKSVRALSLSTATTPIPNFGEGPDPYQGFQIHDYLQVSFLRRDPLVKAATNKTIELLGRHYPETLSRKFFVNVPVVMGWVFQAVKMVVAKETTKKFTVLSYGNQLAGELGPGVPRTYGGEKAELDDVAEGMTLV
ncbi:hypothetical protein BDW02DRAFT_566172 [Decorospora gaudefroyi]|uniref:Phosphatidylinositol transfer protein SFH5 n=1 Tax=Decorospora gaudefroyi TaxID=184978 RepID=A0A6A5KGE0_9PLEO|nr:hypothetical protein BDW02DRAFT_566172 [Decorospora gaudefroyi]